MSVFCGRMREENVEKCGEAGDRVENHLPCKRTNEQTSIFITNVLSNAKNK